MPNAFGEDLGLTEGDHEHYTALYARGWNNLEAFANAATDGNLVLAYDILAELEERKLLDGWRRGRRKPEGKLDEPGWEDYVEPETPEDRARTARYFEALDAIGKEWEHLMNALTAAGAKNVRMEQTGGMCMLIGWDLDDHGSYAWLSGSDGPLAHERVGEPSGMPYVGIYLGWELDKDGSEGFHVFGRLSDPEGDEALAKRLVPMGAALHTVYSEEHPRPE